jgi:3-hydroxybutyryl-CoA dehydrogenase
VIGKTILVISKAESREYRRMAALECSRRVGVIGAGAMGAGIAQVAAAAGHPVVLYDAMDGAAEAGRKRIVEGLDGLVSRGRLAREDAEALSARIEVVGSLEEFADVALVVEAIVERLDVKRDALANLEEIVAADAILATNTSSLSITSIARDTKVPGRIAGMHFFNPAPVMKLSRFQRGGQRMLAMIPYRDRMREANHGRQVPCCGE